jgi:hypothetical protein
MFGFGPKSRKLLKPAHEPICVAYKPGGKRQLQIDECRIPLTDDDTLQGGISGRTGRSLDKAGRWGFRSVDREPGLDVTLLMSATTAKF